MAMALTRPNWLGSRFASQPATYNFFSSPVFPHMRLSPDALIWLLIITTVGATGVYVLT